MSSPVILTDRRRANNGIIAVVLIVLTMIICTEVVVSRLNRSETAVRRDINTLVVELKEKEAKDTELIQELTAVQTQQAVIHAEQRNNLEKVQELSDILGTTPNPKKRK